MVLTRVCVDEQGNITFYGVIFKDFPLFFIAEV